MASSLLALIDDIASLLGDVSVLSGVAAKKTAGVLGDDVALNAYQVAGVAADRELAVVWAVARGSLVNKAILVPAALAISALVPWAVTPLLMAGGAFLCFEGFEKLVHRYGSGAGDEAARHQALATALSNPAVDPLVLERDKVRGAVRTDFILSAEIITITLGTVAGNPFMVQLSVLAGIAVIMTVGVYGLVAAIVKLDDLGLFLSRRPSAAMRALGTAIVKAAPWLMKGLSVAGTVAMFLVGGGILVHGIEPLGHALSQLGQGLDARLATMLSIVLDAMAGIVAGALVLAVWSFGQRVLRRKAGS